MSRIKSTFTLFAATLLALSACNLPQSQPTQQASPAVAMVSVSVPSEYRSGPGPAYDLVGELQPGEMVPALGISPDAGYFLIQDPAHPGSLAWLKTDHTTLTGGSPGLPVATPPALPTAAAPTEPVSGCPTPVGGGPTPVSCSGPVTAVPSGGCPTPVGGGPTPVSCGGPVTAVPGSSCPTPVGGGPTPVSCSGPVTPVPGSGCPTPVGGGPTPVSCSGPVTPVPGSGCPTPVGGGPTPVSCTSPAEPPTPVGPTPVATLVN